MSINTWKRQPVLWTIILWFPGFLFDSPATISIVGEISLLLHDCNATNVIYIFQGIYGYPIEIQALLYMKLRCTLQMLKPDGEGEDFIEKVGQRLHALTYHMRNYFRLDFPHLNNISRYKTEEYSHTAVNRSSLFNILFLFLLIRLAWKMMIHFIMASYFIFCISCKVKRDFC